MDALAAANSVSRIQSDLDFLAHSAAPAKKRKKKKGSNHRLVSFLCKTGSSKASRSDEAGSGGPFPAGDDASGKTDRE